MRRSLVMAGVVIAVAVLAVPAVRRGVAGRVDRLADGVRGRVAAFQQDYATRESELRARLLPEPDAVEAAGRRRATTDLDDVEPY